MLAGGWLTTGHIKCGWYTPGRVVISGPNRRHKKTAWDGRFLCAIRNGRFGSRFADSVNRSDTKYSETVAQ